MPTALLERVSATCARIPAATARGSVTGTSGLSVNIAGLEKLATVGDRVEITSRDGRNIPAEIISFRDGEARAMAFGSLDGIGPGATAAFPLFTGRHKNHPGGTLQVSDAWIGRVIDPLGRPLDGKGPLPPGPARRPVRASPPDATSRARLGPRIDLGVRALNAFATCREGQRLGLFAGSGVGKSTLLSMLACNTACDVAVISLVGERGRELREFIEDDLGPEGLARSVVIIATSDTPPLMRREAAYAATTVAEYFRDQNRSVLPLMDSVTRFCHALREIGLSVGEPPATRGYPPSVFAELPRLLERAGPGLARPDGVAGQISALLTVLVEGDDQNEPVADAVRGILDGHIVMDRRIGEAGRYPAIDVLRSLSRVASSCISAEEAALVGRARGILAIHTEMADMIRLGAYRHGSDPKVDEAIRLLPAIEDVLRQGKTERASLDEGFAALAGAIEAGADLPA